MPEQTPTTASRDTPILIVGAGPTGLVLALSLQRQGVPFRIISKAAGPGEQSRAMGVQARTLEFYRQFGIADAVVAAGIKAATVHLREARANGDGFEVTSFSLKDLGEGLSPYPFMLSYPQDAHERFLINELAVGGAVVEWGTTLTGCMQDERGVSVSLQRANGGNEETDFAYVCGCDGAHSQVRECLGIGFSGATYEQMFYVADVEVDGGFDADVYANLGEHVLVIMMPVRATGMQRLLGLLPPGMTATKDTGFDVVREDTEALIGRKVTKVNWFSPYRVHHRVADRFQQGRAFLLGDAGHIHSPVGGQGMNTGIGDAVNLAWKLAQIVQGRAPAILLDSYEPERIAFARTLVGTTDRIFEPMIAQGIKGTLMRRLAAPLAVTLMPLFAVTRHAAFRTLSQIHIHYPDSPLSEGKAGSVSGGDRLPWIADADNYALLSTLDWQVHIYGQAEPELNQICEHLGVALHVLPWTDGAHQAGLRQDAVYLIRPDGYIGLASHSDSATALRAYSTRLGLGFSQSSGGAIGIARLQRPLRSPTKKAE